MIVVDANILIRAILGRRAQQIIETYATRGARFLAPEVAFEDAKKYLPALLKKYGKPDGEALASLQNLRQHVESIEPELYSECEAEARTRLQGRDEDDWPVLALALALDCAIWTEDADFFGTGIPVWTTNRVEIFLKSQLNLHHSE